MRKARIQISYDAEKLDAIEDYAAKKGVDLMAEIDETIGRVYEKWNCQEKRTPKLLVKAVKLAPSVAIEMTGM